MMGKRGAVKEKMDGNCENVLPGFGGVNSLIPMLNERKEGDKE